MLLFWAALPVLTHCQPFLLVLRSRGRTFEKKKKSQWWLFVDGCAFSDLLMEGPARADATRRTQQCGRE